MPLAHLYALPLLKPNFSTFSAPPPLSGSISLGEPHGGKSLALLLFKLGRWTAGEHRIDRPLKASFPPSPLHPLPLASLTVNCLAFAGPLLSLPASAPIAGHPPASISSSFVFLFFFSSLRMLVEVTNLQEGVERRRRGGGCLLSICLTTAIMGRKTAEIRGGLGGEAQAAGGYGTGMVGGVGKGGGSE